MTMTMDELFKILLAQEISLKMHPGDKGFADVHLVSKVQNFNDGKGMRTAIASAHNADPGEALKTAIQIATRGGWLKLPEDEVANGSQAQEGD